MSKKRRQIQRRPTSSTGESRSADVLTVGWMLCVLTALVCEVALVVLRLYLILSESTSPWLMALATLLQFAATVIGLISLGLAVAVVRTRREPPPRGVLVFAVVVGVAPIVATLARLSTT